MSKDTLNSVYILSRNSKNNVLECRVCEDVFTLQGDKVPRLLYCGHTICHACLLRLPLVENSIQCPFDRQTTPVSNSGVWGLKKNFALLELLERLQFSQDKNSSLYLSSDLIDKERQLMVYCDEDERHLAVLYCTVCMSSLCEQCSEMSHSTRTLARHRRILLSEKPKEKPKCPMHPSHVAEFTCLELDCQAQGSTMCFICKDYGRHKNHKHALVETEAENVRSMFSIAVQQMRKFMEDLSETLHKLEQTTHQLENTEDLNEVNEGIGTAEQARQKVRTHFQQLRETLEIQEAIALSAVDTHVRERLCSLEQLAEDLRSSLSQVAAICVQCEQAVIQDDIRLLTLSRELREALDSVEKNQQQFSELAQDQLHPDASIPITFTKDNRVHIGPKIEMRVVTLGLDGAGKTSVLFKLKQDEFMPATPTIGFNVETIEYNNVKFTFWDVGGQCKLRPLWRHYYLNTQAVVFVVDSKDHSRFTEAQVELAKLMSEKELKDAAFLILANKQDLEGSANIEQITQHLGLSKICYGRSCHVQPCDAQSGQGLHEGLDWLSRQLLA